MLEPKIAHFEVRCLKLQIGYILYIADPIYQVAKLQ